MKYVNSFWKVPEAEKDDTLEPFSPESKTIPPKKSVELPKSSQKKDYVSPVLKCISYIVPFIIACVFLLFLISNVALKNRVRAVERYVTENTSQADALAEMNDLQRRLSEAESLISQLIDENQSLKADVQKIDKLEKRLTELELERNVASDSDEQSGFEDEYFYNGHENYVYPQYSLPLPWLMN